MARADDRGIGIVIKESFLDVIEKTQEIALTVGFAHTAGEEGIANEQVDLAVDFRDDGGAARGVATQDVDRQFAVSERQEIALVELMIGSNRQGRRIKV